MTDSYETEATKLMKLCPKYQSCSAPKCPADIRRTERSRRLDDEPECQLRGVARQRLMRELRKARASTGHI